MPILRILLLLALGAAGPALAETLSTETGDPGAVAERPNRGTTMATVQSRFGEPTNRHATVGNPPITRWIARISPCISRTTESCMRSSSRNPSAG